MRTTMIIAVLGVCGAGCEPARARPDAGAAAPCVLDSETEQTPGFPFDPKVFRDRVWPILAGACATAGCHLAPARAGGFEMWPLSDSACDFARSFNAVYQHSDFRIDPARSTIYTRVSGAAPDHPALAAPERAILLDYITSAYDAYADTPHPSAYFDFEAYQTTIQPMLESTGCLQSGCHARPPEPDASTNGYSLHVAPLPDSAEMEENFRAAVDRVGADQRPEATHTPLYTRATDAHRGVRLSSGDAGILAQWIAEAVAALPSPEPGCANPDAFSASVFRDEIMPVLNGEVDLNDRDSGRTTTGCTRSVCHGQDRGPGTLYLDPAAPVADNLARFACFVDTVNPSASQIIVCPLSSRYCALEQHPGDDIFSGYKDRNLQRILSFIYAANSSATPLDFAFYARRIDPIFNDPAAVQKGALGRTCADTQVCHGTLVAGTPPNGSNFGIIPEAGAEQDLLLNFVSSANFTHFLDPGQSSLFLYPTNEIANRDNDLATGLPHPGGKDFETDDPEALLILQWADGLRPDAQGFQRHWLVAGDFPASQVTDEKIPGEHAIQPRIFEPSGQTVLFHAGAWNGFFSDAPFVDLDDPQQGFFRPTAFARMVYAVAYVINTSTRNIETVLTVRSPNDVQISGGGQSIVGRDGQGATLIVTFPSYARTRQITRLMVKVLQREGDHAFGFDMQLSDTRGNSLTDRSRELVIKLGPEGGI